MIYLCGYMILVASPKVHNGFTFKQNVSKIARNLNEKIGNHILRKGYKKALQSRSLIIKVYPSSYKVTYSTNKVQNQNEQGHSTYRKRGLFPLMLLELDLWKTSLPHLPHIKLKLEFDSLNAVEHNSSGARLIFLKMKD